MQVKWDKTEEKPAVIAITTAAFVGVWALSGLVDRIDRLPVIGGLLELVGLVVTSWFVYRYLVFGPDRYVQAMLGQQAKSACSHGTVLFLANCCLCIAYLQGDAI